MPHARITFTPAGTRGMTCVLSTRQGWTLTVEGDLDAAEPVMTGHEALAGNRVIATNLWAYACSEKQRRLARRSERRAMHAKQAEQHADLVCSIADLVERQGNETRTGWCSACFARTDHRRVRGNFEVPTYLCSSCGAGTLTCAAPRCSSMATRGFGPFRMPRYCAEHRHDLPSFAHAGDRMKELTDYATLFKPRRSNLARVSRVAGGVAVAAGAMTGVGLVAAPLIGGAIGTMVGGYSGAAATSYGLALLGGGSLAAGGLGMAGGSAIVAATGAGLGSVMGARITHGYLGEDKSFAIEKLADGPGVPVVVCSGFLTEGRTGWGDWQEIVQRRYPESPVYRVHWGAQDLKALSAVLGQGLGKAAFAQGLKFAVKGASKKGAGRAHPLGGGLIAVDIVNNPWFRARQRANKTGAVLADLIARTEVDELVLVGHSLGARVMVCAVQALGTKENAPKVRELHLLGAAIGANTDWTDLHQGVAGMAYNYHSRNDKVLRFFYTTAQGGTPAAGYAGMKTRHTNIKNVDVSSKVKDHSAYCLDVTLR